jgi:hypothetical protein
MAWWAQLLWDKTDPRLPLTAAEQLMKHPILSTQHTENMLVTDMRMSALDVRIQTSECQSPFAGPIQSQLWHECGELNFCNFDCW